MSGLVRRSRAVVVCWSWLCPRWVYRRFVIVRHHTIVFLHYLERQLVRCWAAVKRAAAACVAALVYVLWSLLCVKVVGGAAKWVGSLIRACCHAFYHSFAHTHGYRRWHRRLRKVWRLGSLLCCWCCQCGRQSGQKFFNPDLSDSGESSEDSDEDGVESDDDDRGGAGATKKRKGKGKTARTRSGDGKGKGTLEDALDVEEKAGGDRALLAGGLGRKGKKAPVVTGKKARALAASRSRSGRGKTVAFGGASSGWGDDDDLVASDPLLALQVKIDDEGARMAAKQLPRPVPPKPYPRPPGLLDETAAILYSSYDLMDAIIAAAYIRSAADSTEKQTLWAKLVSLVRQYVCSWSVEEGYDGGCCSF